MYNILCIPGDHFQNLSNGKTGEQLHSLQDDVAFKPTVLTDFSLFFNVFFIVVLPVVILAFSLPQYV